MPSEQKGDDGIAITGLAGRYPESANIEEFWENLLSGSQLYTADDRRWPLDHMNLPKNMGKIPNIERFDASFFNLSNREAHEMDPQFKICHETTFEAIIDAGLDPAEIANDRTGMFTGFCYSDSWLAQTEDASVYESRWTEYFSEVSKCFHFKGPCMTYDSACASSFSALNDAFHAIKAGVVDTAIVAGVAVSLNPYTASAFRQLGMTSADGQSRCMDKGANGYVRSETICSILLQRQSLSKRVYAVIVNCRSNSDGYKKDGITFPGKDSMIRLMKETFEEVNIDPKDVKYIEAHVTGTQVGDPVECGAIETIFCPEDRKDPVLMGCLKSNMGHAEGASGTAAITKACLVLQKKLITPNVNFDTPNPNIKGLSDGRLKPVMEPTPFDGNIIALNSFGFGGSNIHTIIKSYDGQPNGDVQKLSGYKGINRLILFKGRTEEMFEILRSMIINEPDQITTEFLDLVNNVANLDDANWNLPYRGYFILDKDKNIIKSVWYRRPSSEAVSMRVSVKYSLDHDSAHLKSMIDILSKASIKVVASHVKGSDADTCSVIIDSKNSRKTAQKLYQLNTTDDVLCLIGDQFMNGVQDVNLKNLYSTIKYPVSRTTASLSPLIVWNHEKVWDVYKVPEFFKCHLKSKRFSFDYAGQFNYLAGHKIDGRIIFPASGYLWAIWQSIALEQVEKTFFAYLKTKIRFWRVRLHQAIIVNDDLRDEIQFITCLNSTNGRFEITRNGSLIVDGYACLDGKASPDANSSDVGLTNKDIELKQNQEDENEEKYISKKDFYKELRVRGYDYEDDFQGVDDCNFNGSKGNVSFLKHWICFADAVFQLSLINDPLRSLYLPTGFELLQVDGGVFADIKSMDQAIYLNIMSTDVVEGSSEIDNNGDEVVKDKEVVDENNNQVMNEEEENVVPKFQVKVSKETKEIFTNGFYVKGLNGISTSRKVAAPFVRAYNEWHPLNEVVEEDKFVLKAKSEYEAQCINLLREVRSKNVASLPAAKDADAKEEDNDDDDQVLIKKLQSLVGQDEVITSDKFSLSKDMLLNIPIDSEGLLHQLSIILDTLGLINIKIAEVNMSYKETLESSVKSLVTGLFSGSEYTYYYNYAPEDVESNTENSVDVLLKQKSKLDADLVIIQHPSLDFKFSHPSNENEEKFQDLIQNLSSQTSDNSFILFIARRDSFAIEREVCNNNNMYEYEGSESIIKRMEESGITVISTKQIGSFDFILFRNVPSSDSSPDTFFVDKNMFTYDWVDDLKDKLYERNEEGTLQKRDNKNPIWVICNEDDVHGMNGFINCLKQEDERIRLLTLPTNLNGTGKLLQEKCFRMNLKTTIVRNGLMGTNACSRNLYGNLSQETPKDKSTDDGQDGDDVDFCLNVRTKGDLSSLYYQRVNIPNNSCNKVNIHYAPLNFKDVMVASGRVPLIAYPESWTMNGTSGDLGMEFSGVTADGVKRIMGIVPTDTIATSVDIGSDHGFMFDVPDSMSLEEASTIPVVYATVYYALIMRGKLLAGESILIHAGSGGVGQAAINVCQSMGCEIYTTVGTNEKRDFIKSTFNITDDHIFDSRSLSFGDDILRATNGRGVDVILNSLSEDKLQTGLECLAVNGRFLEIGKYDFISDSSFDPTKLSMNQSFHAICLAYFMTKCRDYQGIDPDAKCLQTLMNEGLKNGTIKPLPRTMFDWNQTEEAFRFMASGKHIGKVVIKMKDAKEQMKEQESGRVSIAEKRVSFDADKSYLVIGGLGGMGLELCQWLVNKGVRILIVTSRRGVQRPYQEYCIKRMEYFGCKVFVQTENVADMEEAGKLISFANNLAPIGGIFNLGMVLKDSLFVDLTKDVFEECCAIKVNGSANLDKITRTSCPSLDYFVCFSSIASSFGNAGQSNYGFANSFMDNLICKRRSEGLPGLAIAWGAVGDIGHVAENMGHDVAIGGTVAQRINSCLEVLERSLNGSRSAVSSYRLLDRSSFEVKGNLLATIFNVLGIKDQSKVDPKSTLGDLGIDSLMAVEIKQIIQKKYDKVMTTKEIRELTVGQIKSMGADVAADNATNLNALNDTNLISTGLTLPSHVLEILRNENGNQDPIFIFPPLDGTFVDLQDVIEELSKHFTACPIVGLNWTKETFDHESVPSVATFYVEQLKIWYPKLANYDFIAYSHGSTIALEMATQLQDSSSLEGRKVSNLILLDGSPTFIPKYFKKQMEKKEGSDQKTWISIILEYYGSIGKIDLSEKLTKIPDDAEGIKKAISMIKKVKGNKITDKDCLEAMDRARSKLHMAFNYHQKNRLRMDAHLIKSSDEVFEEDDSISDDYDLNRFVAGNISVVKYEGNHKTFLVKNSFEIASKISTILYH